MFKLCISNNQIAIKNMASLMWVKEYFDSRQCHLSSNSRCYSNIWPVSNVIILYWSWNCLLLMNFLKNADDCEVRVYEISDKYKFYLTHFALVWNFENRCRDIWLRKPWFDLIVLTSSLLILLLSLTFHEFPCRLLISIEVFFWVNTVE